MRKLIPVIAFLFILPALSFAQGVDTAAANNYTRVITERSKKIVDSLNITDAAKYKRVEDIIISQYRTLSDIHDTRNAKAKGLDKPQVAALDSTVDIQLNTAHTAYLSKLSAELSPAQIDKVKDQMTYRILPITYAAYLDELPALTDVQKAQVKTWLVEAREHAIDAESSDKKHAVFGKYKGRINNYLSKQGYDMKAAEIDWQKRIKERQAQKTNG